MQKIFWFFLFALCPISFSHSAEFKVEATITKPNGKALEWSQKLGKFSNGCVDNRSYFDAKKCTRSAEYLSRETYNAFNFYIIEQDSFAAMACNEIGGRLPTIEESVSLVKYGKPHFVISNQDDFWTARVGAALDKDFANYAYTFNSYWGNAQLQRRDIPLTVRCVRDL